MILDIVHYGHPALRAKGRPIKEVDQRIRKLAEDMIETMEDASGVGLAAQQVGIPMQLCVIDVRDMPDRPSKMWIGGRPVDFEDFMPMVLVNPELALEGEPASEIEGCLSFPGVLGEVPRPGRVRVKARNLDWEEVEFETEGLLGRAVQHEADHLNGVLFIDRMTEETRKSLHGEIGKIAGF